MCRIRLALPTWEVPVAVQIDVHTPQDACQSPSRRAGSYSPRQQPGLSLAALPAIPETAEGAMQRALSSGEEGRRGQRAYASFMHSTGGSLDVVSMRLSQLTRSCVSAVSGNTCQEPVDAHCSMP